jgi:hypothetical protein
MSMNFKPNPLRDDCLKELLTRCQTEEVPQVVIDGIIGALEKPARLLIVPRGVV